MPSVEVRIAIVVVLVVFLIAHRMGFFKWLKRSRQEKAERQEKEKRLAVRREKLQAAREREELKARRTAEILRRAAPGLQQKSVTAAGQEIFYLDGGAQGDGDDAVLLLHGFGGGKEDWAGLASRLTVGGLRVVAPDLPGFGQNEKDPDLSYDVTTQAKRIRAFYQRLDLQRFHIVGWSLGGVIAAACAYASPEEIQSLTLIEPLGVRVPYQSELDKLLEQGRNPMVIATPAAYDNLLEFLYSNPPKMAPALKRYRAEEAANSRAFYLKVWREVFHGERAHLLDLLLPELKQSTLVLLGAESRVVHASAAEVIRAMMPDRAQTAVVEGCGHLPMVERPGEVGERLLRFLQASGSRTSAGAAAVGEAEG